MSKRPARLGRGDDRSTALRSFFRESSVPAAICDRDSRIVEANPAWADLLPSALEGSKVSDELSGIETLLWSRGDASDFVHTRDGRRLRVRLAHIEDCILVSLPAPESAELDGDGERTRQLECRVTQSEKLAGLGRLSATIVHELNNPLTSITVYAEYLQERLAKIGDSKDQDRAGRILESAQRMLELTRNLTAYARPSSESMARVDLREVIEKSRRLCDHVLQESNASFKLEWGEDIPPVFGHQDALQQVFINLMTNACQALDERGSITIEGRRDGRRVEVVVADDGHGMAEDVRHRAFEPFFSTKARGRGTGLGLSIVKEIIGRHGGGIKVESEPGAGTRFIIRLRAAPSGD